MALGLLGDLGVEEIPHRPQAVGRERATHGVEERGRAREQSRLEQGRRHAEVGERFLPAVIDGSNAVAGLKPNVPEKREEPLEGRGPGCVGVLRQQHHHVNVGAGQELAAAVAADREQRRGSHGATGMQLPGADHQRVHERGTIVDQRLDRFLGLEATCELTIALDERRAKIRNGPGRAIEAAGQ